MKYDVVLLPSFAQVEAWRKAKADAHAGESFGQAVATFDSWIADLWELQGDGRLLVDNVQREVLMYATFADAVGEDEARGLAPVASSCMRAAAGVPAFEKAIAEAVQGCDREEFSSRERAFLKAMGSYEVMLERRGLVEPGQAAAYLSSRSAAVFPQPVRVFMPEASPLTWVQDHFFSCCDEVDLVVEPAKGGDGVGRAPAGVEVRFACPAGALAQPGLVADLVERFEAERGAVGDVVVTAKDPLALFERFESRLGESHRLVVQASKPSPQTDFGKAFLLCWHCAHEDPWDPAALSDVLFTPFSGMSHAAAVEFDRRSRADRLLDREGALKEACEASSMFAQLVALTHAPKNHAGIKDFEQFVQTESRRGRAWQAEQMAALGALERAMTASSAAGAGMGPCVSVLKRMSLGISVQGGARDAGALGVTITALPSASRLAPGSFALAIACDLTSERYAVADKDDAKATLFSKLQMSLPESALDRARREFCALLALPTSRIVLMRPLGDDNAGETYPAAVLEEFVDEYREDPSDADEVSNPYRLPEAMQEGLALRGEELLYANAASQVPACVQGTAAWVDRPAIGFVSPERTGLVGPRRYAKDGTLLEKACPSPSQVELYLECPLKWFADRKMRTEAIDEGFGPMERGSFAHAVLEEFYKRFQERGYAKVSEANIGEARVLMRATASEILGRQYGEEPGSGRYVPATELERREASALCAQLVSFLDFEARLLPTFHPAYLEHEIDPEHAVSYADHLLVGKVDRIDVDDAGNAVIIDYKGSINDEHAIAGKTWRHPGKVQTRIYARAIEHALGLHVVGALYVSYGKRPAIAGAYDPRVLEAAHLPGMRHDRCACGLIEEDLDRTSDEYSLAAFAFGRMLDETEDLASCAISRMTRGDIQPNPAYDDACKYCNVLACPKRGA